MMRFEEIKLIIWDLDETLWEGILSDGDVELPEQNRKLLSDLIDAGVVCAICSKNDPQKVDEELKKKGIAEYFVFNSINWTPKGQRVKQIITEMNLRPANVLFIDDNPLNRSEVSNCCPESTVADIDIIPKLSNYYSTVAKTDINHNRLKQYQVLEKKVAFKAAIGNNEEFLHESNIVVSLHNDCLENLDRISDLVLRSNQLNFTKLRSTKDELKNTICNSDNKSGYVRVSDRFGDYGIVGFYVVSNRELLHFVFSCRTLGMGIEQYVYKEIGCPEISIVGEVASDLLSPDPVWINSDSTTQQDSKECIRSSKVLIKGPCDMQQMFAYIAENHNIITEFVYVNKNGVNIEQGNHSMHVVQSLSISEYDVQRLSQYLPFGDKDMYRTKMFDEDLGFVVYSLFTDPNLGLYREKGTGIIVAFGEYVIDFTDRNNWDDIIAKRVFVANCNISRQFLEDFSRKFEYLGRIKVEQIIQNLEMMYSNIGSSTRFVLVLGSERELANNTKLAYEDRHLYHKELNQAVRKWAQNKNRIDFIDVNEFATSPDDYLGNINHFTRAVYYKMSKRLIEIVQDNGGDAMRQNGEIIAKITHIKRKIKKIPVKFKTFFSR